MTATISETELSRWFPFKFEEITDPEATPEPSKGALLKLARGPHFVLYWGEVSNQLTVLIPKTTDASVFLTAFFREVPLPKSRVLWHRAGSELAVHSPAKITAKAADVKKNKETSDSPKQPRLLISPPPLPE